MTTKIDIHVISDSEIEHAVQADVSSRTAHFSSIEYEGRTFAVLTWIANHDLGLKKPEWVIPIADVPHQIVPDDATPCRWRLTNPLPGSLFDASASRQVRRQFRVEPAPNLTFKLNRPRH
ncbi:hypothetical protein [Pararhizobium sp. PWRC1-1]|uniref:hypothetical protein n=1 Tax=Pararhizobium sp. PWRC1-1 TaxID=2804566 RepID=UPI003CEA7E8B